MAADVLASGSSTALPVTVTVFDRMPSVGRKFLLAGRSGLNLTYHEPPQSFLARYGDREDELRASIQAFPPEALRAWSASLGEATFVGSSGRVFPESMRATPLLRAWLRRLDALGVQFVPRHRWVGWDDDDTLVFDTTDRVVHIRADATLLALGGASWPRTGSDGDWVGRVREAGIRVRDLEASNCGVLVQWTPAFRDRCAGRPLKNVELGAGDRRLRGDVTVTSTGLEGGPVYALTPQLRRHDARLTIDLRPDVATGALAQRLARRRPKDSTATALRKIGLSPVAIDLLRECTRTFPKDPHQLAARIKSVPVTVAGVDGVARAISTAGGVCFDDLDDHLMVRNRPGTFVAGEMLDWEAPTGGYLLQACFSTAVRSARGMQDWLGATSAIPAERSSV